MSFSNVDLNTIIYFAAIIVAVVVVFSILSFIFKHLIHWFARMRMHCICRAGLLCFAYCVKTLLAFGHVEKRDKLLACPVLIFCGFDKICIYVFFGGRMKIDIIGIPIDLGADRRGVDMGPSAIRYAHLQKKLEALGYIVEDKGNIEVPIAEMCSIAEPKLKYIDCIVPMSRRAAGAVSTSVMLGNFPVVLGGDHSLSLGSISRCGKIQEARRDLD